MAAPRSAGLLLYRIISGRLEVFLAHPGGPIFANRDDGWWGIPKGHFERGETPIEVALREFHEETGQTAAACGALPHLFIDLGSVVQRGGKRVFAWAFEGEWPKGREVQSNLFNLQWPPRSGRYVRVPEIDRAEFFTIDSARIKINPAQEPLLDRLLFELHQR